MYLILLGPPGVGKGTQAQFLIEDLHAVQLSTGDLLRAAIRHQTELGREAKGYMDKGELVPDKLILGMIRERLSDIADQPVIFDGFPRTVAQAQGLDEELARIGKKVDLAIELVVDDQVVIKRLSARRVHPGSGRVYNLLFNPPKVDEKDDLTGEALVHRDDDQPEVIENRLKVYHRQTEPVAGFYRDQQKLVSVDADGSVEEVRRRMQETMKAATPNGVAKVSQ